MTNNHAGKIIPFAQNATFYMKRGNKEMGRNDLLAALTRYRQAYLSAPNEAEPCLAMAEILSQMQRFEESNRLLLLLMSTDNATPEFYFGLACNYFGMREYDYAVENLERYLDVDPDGPFALEAEEFLDVIDDDEAMYEMTGLRTDADYDDSASIVFARHLLDAGDFADAVAELQRQMAVSPNNVQVQNMLAIAYFCMGERAQAAGLLTAILAQHPDNVQARCHMALYCHQNGDDREAAAHLHIAKAHCNDGTDELQNLSVLELELEQYEAAESTLRRLQQQLPYDQNVLHKLGYCRYMRGDPAGARECYKRLLKIDPDDMVARYYYGQSQKNEAMDAQTKSRWLIAYEVPFSETFRRLNQINKILGQHSGDLLEVWEQDSHFQRQVRWALTLGDRRIKRSMLSLLFTFGDARAEYFLREFLLQTSQPDDLKRVVFGMLKRMEAPEPYMAYLNGQWIQGRVNMLAFPYKLPVAYENVVELLLQYMVGARSEACVSAAAKIFHAYIESLDRHFPRLTGTQEISMAAALEYLGCSACGETVDEDEILKAYRVTPIRFRNALTKLRPFLPAGVQRVGETKDPEDGEEV